MPRPRVMYLRAPVGEGRDEVPSFVRIAAWGWCWEEVTVCEDWGVG